MFVASLLLADRFSADSNAADAANAVGPAVVFQAKSIDELLASLNTAAKGFLPEPVLKDFEMGVLSKLDLNKIKGIDSKKPLGLYATIGNRVLQGDFSKSSVVVLVPVSDEKAFVELLAKIDLRPEKKGDDYFVPIPNIPVPAALQFLNGYAYISVATAKVDASSLLDSKEVFSNKETAAAVLHIRMDRVPDDLKKHFLASYTQNMEQQIETLKKTAGPADGPATPQVVRAETALRTMAWGTRWIKLLINDGKDLILRVDLDPKTGLIGVETSLKARNGSDLAKSIGRMRPTKNDFAGLIGDDSAGHILVQTPLFIDDVKDMLGKLTFWVGREAERHNQVDAPKGRWEVVAEAAKAVNRTLNDENLDFAASMRGPDRNGQFTVIGAFSLKDTAPLEKALKTAVKSAPKGEFDMVKLDAFKVQGINVHEITVGDQLPAQAQKVFGKSSVYVALSANAMFVTLGPQGKESINDALTRMLVPKPVPQVQGEISGKRILSLYKTLGAPPEAFQFIEKLTPAERSTVMAIKVEGGDKLVLRLELGLPALWILSPKPAR